MSSLALKNAIRRSKRETRLPRKVCPYCFERDHIGGHNHVPHIIVETCQYHHALLTEARLEAGAEMTKQRATTKTVAMGLRSLAVTIDALKVAMGQCAEGLRWLATKLEMEQ